MDDWREELRRAKPDIVILTGGAHEPRTQALARAARDQETGVLPLAPGMDVVAEVERIQRRRELQRETGIAGESAPIQELLVRIEQMAPVSSTVLVQGESGTGKELVAKAIHDLSLRRGKPFIAVNCAALPESLLESELFGHEKGAFTGAAERRLGRFELADGGTIFLDEIGEIPASVQVKLLRVLESRQFFRVGGIAPIKVDVRVVAATNRSLRDAVGMGQFRDDLYYRLNVIPIHMPPLRERREDIPLLVYAFMAIGAFGVVGAVARRGDAPSRATSRSIARRRPGHRSRRPRRCRGRRSSRRRRPTAARRAACPQACAIHLPT